ncbi:hypothetical protein ACJ41O_010842 [Fusarium nematophilum]
MRPQSLLAVVAALSFTGINASRCQPHPSQSLSSSSKGTTTATASSETAASETATTAISSAATTTTTVTSEDASTSTAAASSTTTGLTSEDASTSTTAAASSTTTAPAPPEPTCQEMGGPPSWPVLDQYESRNYGTSDPVSCSQYCQSWADCKIYYTDSDSVRCVLYKATFEEISWRPYWDFAVWSERACVILQEPQ